MYVTRLDSPVGELTLASDGLHLNGLWIRGQKYDRCFPGAGRSISDSPEIISDSPEIISDGLKIILDSPEGGRGRFDRSGDAPEIFGRTKDWLERYFAGKRPSAMELPLAPPGSAFQKEVWKRLCEIPYGSVTTYGALAKEMAAFLGRSSMSAQAVGGAVGHNPISIIIPCHRVVGSDGSLTGYAGGIEKKRRLLLLEGVDVDGLSQKCR